MPEQEINPVEHLENLSEINDYLRQKYDISDDRLPDHLRRYMNILAEDDQLAAGAVRQARHIQRMHNAA